MRHRYRIGPCSHNGLQGPYCDGGMSRGRPGNAPAHASPEILKKYIKTDSLDVAEKLSDKYDYFD